jgi:hypothetical protein
MTTIGLRTTLAALALVFAAFAFTPAVSLADPAPAGAPAIAPEPAHVVTEAEIQDGIDARLHSEAADRQAIRDLLARPEVRRIAGTAGLDLARADAAVGALSGAELERLASQARDANSTMLGGDSILLSTTTIIIIVVVLVVLIAIS